MKFKDKIINISIVLLLVIALLIIFVPKIYKNSIKGLNTYIVNFDTKDKRIIDVVNILQNKYNKNQNDKTIKSLLAEGYICKARYFFDRFKESRSDYDQENVIKSIYEAKNLKLNNPNIETSFKEIKGEIEAILLEWSRLEKIKLENLLKETEKKIEELKKDKKSNEEIKKNIISYNQVIKNLNCFKFKQLAYGFEGECIGKYEDFFIKLDGNKDDITYIILQQSYLGKPYAPAGTNTWGNLTENKGIVHTLLSNILPNNTEVHTWINKVINEIIFDYTKKFEKSFNDIAIEVYTKGSTDGIEFIIEIK